VRFTWNDRNRIDLAYFISVPKSCNVDLTTADGSITVGNVDGRHRARAELGKIFFRRIDGSLDAVCGEGDIIMSRCSGDATLRTRRGTIRIGWVGGKADLKNSSGDIEIQNAVGGLTAHAEAGDVQAGFPKEVTGDAKVTTNGGTIYARFDAEAHCSIDATSSVLGHVESSLPLASESGSVSRSHLAGKLNGGGTKIVLKASGGHVKIDSATVPIDE
jgi:DUF4097 and DUF4098 domain-containing protein YvlB